MTRGGRLVLALSAVAIGAYWAGTQNRVPGWLPGWALPSEVASDGAAGPVVYYRHPDGRPIWSATPRESEDGRPFTAVHASEELILGPTPPAKARGERRILYYRNPMGLPDTSPVPKKDSMGMDYIPVVEGEEANDPASLALSPGKIQRTGVKTAAAARIALQDAVRVPATIAFDERRINVVATRTEAFIESVADVTTGQRIGEGAPLVELYAREMALAGADLVTNLGSGGPTAGAVQRLKNLGVPDAVIADVQRTGKVPLRISISAPAGGIVLERNAVVGMMAPPGQALFRIADTAKVWAIADVPEYLLASVKTGNPVLLRVRSLPGREFAGDVDLIYPEVQTETRTARVRIELDNPEGLLLANMLAEAEISAGGRDTVVAVPEGAVIDTGRRQLIFVDKGNGRFEPRDVEAGARSQGMIEIRKGVEAGERVVVSANFLLDAESNLEAALSAMSPGQP